ncbi:MAG: redox-sensitive transcriptional activator SoxR [Rubrivivax sp.]|nr:redox-sensitive transcriptional activator SoxR [Rubrivivax sp.]
MAIGEFARRAGVAASALRFYEAEGLLAGRRSPGGRRLYRRADLRRVAFVRVAQSVGLSLADIRTALATLPEQRTPTRADWQRLSRQWQPLIDERIATLVRLRERLASCIGCGCLSLKTCALVNPADVVAVRGPGPRYLLGERPPATPGRNATNPPKARRPRRARPPGA